ncbi:hypothetical protein H6G33_17830 [Calothrix sp. FACHB-1219]|uniref:hypothetical protein n=1 Tax=unclassified Calothrix TaxID=2619626 RepID=UPI001684A876|nr:MULTISPECIES: hypothetical protein [unclassified Calothrix]MBD2202739.1 hypothetical protein [Calothrix sp. FACHB-168]MBD2218892.1 hypothetical protein [Calothrix sp. FACHB-1219]
MNEDKNLWLEAAKAISEELKKQPPEVQQAAKELSRKTYPETWKARRERGE